MMPLKTRALAKKHAMKLFPIVKPRKRNGVATPASRKAAKETNELHDYSRSVYLGGWQESWFHETMRFMDLMAKEKLAQRSAEKPAPKGGSKAPKKPTAAKNAVASRTTTRSKQ